MQYFYIHSLPIPSSYYCTIQQYSLYLLQQTSTKITKEIDDGIFLTSDERDTISSTTLSYLGTQSLSNLLLVTIPVAKPIFENAFIDAQRDAKKEAAAVAAEEEEEGGGGGEDSEVVEMASDTTDTTPAAASATACCCPQSP